MRVRLTILRLALFLVVILASTVGIFESNPPIPATAAAPARQTVTESLKNMGEVRDSDPRFGVVQAFSNSFAASRIGVRWERITFWWKEMQPTGSNSWNVFATNHDQAINEELRAGRSIAGLLINTPDWAATTPSVHGASVPKGLYLQYNDPRNYWGHFVGQMARRYAGRINDWIIWNEVSIPHGQWHTWNGSHADYVQLVKVAYQAAKAANRNTRIILAGDPYWYDRGAWFKDTVQRLSAEPGAAANNDFFDAANLHLYNRPTDLAPIITNYQRVLAALGLHKPIWLSETNAVPYNDPLRVYPRAGYFASMDDQASYIIEAFGIALALGVQRIEINRMTDGTDFAAGGEPFGLLRNNGSPRPALFSYRTVSVLLSHVTGGSLSENSRTGVYTLLLHRPGERITIVWDQSPVSASVDLAVPHAGAILYDKFGNVMPLTAHQGYFHISLAAATGNTDANNRNDYVIGGSPEILVQQTH